MRVLLINPIIETGAKTGYFPLGLGYIAAILMRKKHQVEILDINAEQPSQSALESYLATLKADVIGTTSYLKGYSYLRSLVKMLKVYHPKIPVIIGGGLATAYPKLLLEKTGTDICVMYEGEETIVEILGALANHTSLEKIRGISFNQDGTIRVTETARTIPSLPGNCSTWISTYQKGYLLTTRTKEAST